MKSIEDQLLEEIIAIESEEIQVGSAFHAFNFHAIETEEVSE